MIDVKIDNQALARATQLLQDVPGGIEQAMVSSLNRALLQGRTAGTRAATKEYTVKANIVRRTMAMHKASKADISAELVSRGGRLPLYQFKHTPRTDTTGSKRKQVRVAVKRGVLKPLGQGFVYNGLVMQRLGETRLPVQQNFSLSVPNILDNENVVENIQNSMYESVEKRLAHETRRILSGYGV